MALPIVPILMVISSVVPIIMQRRDRARLKRVEAELAARDAEAKIVPPKSGVIELVEQGETPEDRED